MRKFIFCLILLLSFGFIISSCSDEQEIQTVTANIYYADAEINRLLPYKTEIIDSDAEAMAEDALEKLINGRNNNEKIRRLLPGDPDCVSVRVEGNIAYVNLASEIKQSLPDSRDIERLLVYQIVDTLTGIKGIRFVKFTVDGAVHKDFMGYMDMREVYKYTYPE